jgi:hypothetical protein
MKTCQKQLVRNFIKNQNKTNNISGVLNSVQLSNNFNGPKSLKNFRQTNHMADIIATADYEEKQRHGKMLEKTNKVYKPSKTITFDRNGELLLFSCHNVKHTNLYFKYPYIMIDSMIPLAAYNFFVDPCK